MPDVTDDEHEPALSWNAVLQLSRQMRTGRKIIFALGPGPLSPRGDTVEIGLDEDDLLAVFVRTQQGEAVLRCDTASSRMLFERGTYVRVEVVGEATQFSASIAVDNREVARQRFPGRLRLPAQPLTRIGADLKGERNAAFKLGELMIYAHELDEKDRDPMWGYLQDKWDLGE